MLHFSTKEIESWADIIEKKATESGLDFYPQEFNLVDSEEMIDVISYFIPNRYSHWSFGKSVEKMRTLYDQRLSSIPYEVVVCSDPAQAYILERDTLGAALLTIAHVYGHNDFFKNNLYFSKINARNVIKSFRMHARKVKGYKDNPNIGEERVESVLDAAHALALNRGLDIFGRRFSLKEQKERLLESVKPVKHQWSHLEQVQSVPSVNLHQIPLEPEDDILLFIAVYNRFLEDWERDLLEIVAEESDYFMPYIETKIMNEGWASFWHYRILNELELPLDLHLEFIKLHNSVVAPPSIFGPINPYHLGFRIWQSIFERWENPSEEDKKEYGLKGGQGLEKIFEVRESCRDVAFIREFLTSELMRELHLFSFDLVDEEYVVISKSGYDKLLDKEIREILTMGIGINSIPIIKIIDANYNNQQELLLLHYFDGRELNLEYVNGTLDHVFNIWHRSVSLLTYNVKEKTCWEYKKNKKGIKGSAHCGGNCSMRKYLEKIGYGVSE